MTIRSSYFRVKIITLNLLFLLSSPVVALQAIDLINMPARMLNILRPSSDSSKNVRSLIVMGMSLISAVLSSVSAVYAAIERKDAPKTSETKDKLFWTISANAVAASFDLVTIGILLFEPNNVPRPIVMILLCEVIMFSAIASTLGLVQIGIVYSKLSNTNTKIILGTGTAGAIINVVGGLPWVIYTCISGLKAGSPVTQPI